MTYCGKPKDFAENLALNRTIGFLGTDVPVGVAKEIPGFLAGEQGFIYECDRS